MTASRRPPRRRSTRGQVLIDLERCEAERPAIMCQHRKWNTAACIGILVFGGRHWPKFIGEAVREVAGPAVFEATTRRTAARQDRSGG